MSWVGPHVDRLANCSCEQVRADIEKRGDRSKWMAGFDGFYLTRVIILTMPPLPCMMCIQIELVGLYIVPSVVKILTGKVHYLVPRDLQHGYILKIWIEYIVHVFTCMYINVCMLLN